MGKVLRKRSKNTLQIPVVILGKGWSAVPIPSSDDYKIAAGSEAIRMCERADWLGCNDVPAFDELTSDDLGKASAVILPNFLHVTPPPVNPGPNDAHHFRSHTEYLPALKAAKCKLELYCLHTDPFIGENSKRLPYFGRCRSIADSLIAFLLAVGHREFVTSGIEWGGGLRYHRMFSRQVAKTVRHRKSIWGDIVTRIKKAGGSVCRWEDFRMNPGNM